MGLCCSKEAVTDAATDLVPDASSNLGVFSMEAKVLSAEWKIDDFMANQPNLAATVNSRSFPAEGLPQWYIQLEPRGNVVTKRKFGVYLMLKTVEKGQSAEIDYDIQFPDDNGMLIRRLRCSYGKFTEGNGHGFFLPNDSKEPIPLSQSGKLIIKVDIREIFRVKRWKPYNVAESSITADLGKLLKTAEFADFIVESADGQEFPVNKTFLAVRNPQFFAKMFTSGMREAIEGRVKLPFEGNIVASLLEYLYTDGVSNLTSVAPQLYPAAHQYQLDRLVDICGANIIQNFSANNITDAMKIAGKFGDVKFQSACKEFLSLNDGAIAIQLLCEANFSGDQAGHQGSAQHDQQ